MAYNTSRVELGVVRHREGACCTERNVPYQARSAIVGCDSGVRLATIEQLQPRTVCETESCSNTPRECYSGGKPEGTGKTWEKSGKPAGGKSSPRTGGETSKNPPAVETKEIKP